MIINCLPKAKPLAALSCMIPVMGLTACGAPTPTPDATPDAESPSPSVTSDWSRDILTTRLAVDVNDRTARATLEVAPSTESTGLSLEAQGLTISAVALEDGTALTWARDSSDGSIDIALPKGASSLTIDYSYAERGYDFDGYMASGETFIWPNYCGNLFPCHSDPADGIRFSVTVTGLPPGQTSIAPSTLLPLDAPSYMLGFTYGEYTKHELGTTEAGTRVVFYARSTDDPEAVAAGTASLRGYVEKLESFFGPYPYGPETGAKSVKWCEEGHCEYAGMEEHPYFDVSDGSVYDPTVFSHEASHAWFGDGIRLACWGEDLILSEGTAAYLEIAIIGLVDGEAAAQADTDYYKNWLASSIADDDDHIVWPDTCDEVATYDIWYAVTYSRGALFWLDVEAQVGRVPLLEALAEFSSQYLGQTASMGDLLDTVQTSTGFDPYPLADIWLRSTKLPEGYVLVPGNARSSTRHVSDWRRVFSGSASP